MSASPLPHFLQSAVCGEHVNMKTMQCRQPAERAVVICTSETRDSAQPGEVLALCTTEGWSCCPQLPGSLTGKGSFLLSHYRIWERPWRGIPPSRYAKMLNDLPGETQLVTGSGLILSLCLTDFTFLGYLRKTSTAQSCWWPHPALCGCNLFHRPSKLTL